MSSFLELPAELAQYVLSYLNQPELYAISQVTKSLNSLSEPFLYRHADLRVRPRNPAPRIDKFFYAVFENDKRAGHVKTLSLGSSPDAGVVLGPRSYPAENATIALHQYNQVMASLEHESPPMPRETISVAVAAREYGSYAMLLILFLPSLHHLVVADRVGEILRPLHKVLSQLQLLPRKGRALTLRLSSIREVSCNFDPDLGLHYHGDSNIVSLKEALSFPGILKLNISIPHGKLHAVLKGNPARIAAPGGLALAKMSANTNVSTLILRRTSGIAQALPALLAMMPLLQSLTCEFWYDQDGCGALTSTRPWISLSQLSQDLRKVRHTLKTLILSVEYCRSTEFYFQQPDARRKITGHLELQVFDSLQTLEVPVPFITGDFDFSIATYFEPYLPPGLRHLSLRTDVSRAQFSHPFDTSILAENLTREQSQGEWIHFDYARMDLSYIFRTSLFLLERLVHLESISVWQPPDTKLNWFEDQLLELATTCQNKGVAAKSLSPLMLRWMAAEHWNLVEEVTLFDPKYPQCTGSRQLFRGERPGGIPLGLGVQYLMSQFHMARVRTW